MRSFALAVALLCCVPALAGGVRSDWRQATEAELRQIIPARAPAERERIETEFRTASGVTNGHKFIAGVVMITAGYQAEGKYSHFLIAQVPLRIGDIALRPGQYVFGYKRVDDEAVEVKFYEAAAGRLLGAVRAVRDTKHGVRSFLITPAANGSGKGTMQVGRFLFEYSLGK